MGNIVKILLEILISSNIFLLAVNAKNIFCIYSIYKKSDTINEFMDKVQAIKLVHQLIVPQIL